jgi:hypothetical protein
MCWTHESSVHAYAKLVLRAVEGLCKKCTDLIKTRLYEGDIPIEHLEDGEWMYKIRRFFSIALVQSMGFGQRSRGTLTVAQNQISVAQIQILNVLHMRKMQTIWKTNNTHTPLWSCQHVLRVCLENDQMYAPTFSVKTATIGHRE